jgi:hypothetical protein
VGLVLSPSPKNKISAYPRAAELRRGLCALTPLSQLLSSSSSPPLALVALHLPTIQRGGNPHKSLPALWGVPTRRDGQVGSPKSPEATYIAGGMGGACRCRGRRQISTIRQVPAGRVDLETAAGARRSSACRSMGKMTGGSLRSVCLPPAAAAAGWARALR